MEKAKINEYRELFSKKIKNFWDEVSDDVKWVKDTTEIRVQMEMLEVKQDRLFKEYGKTVFLYGECSGPRVDNLLREIETIEQELQQKYLQLQKLKAQS